MIPNLSGLNTHDETPPTEGWASDLASAAASAANRRWEELSGFMGYGERRNQERETIDGWDFRGNYGYKAIENWLGYAEEAVETGAPGRMAHLVLVQPKRGKTDFPMMDYLCTSALGTDRCDHGHIAVVLENPEMPPGEPGPGAYGRGVERRVNALSIGFGPDHTYHGYWDTRAEMRGEPPTKDGIVAMPDAVLNNKLDDRSGIRIVASYEYGKAELDDIRGLLSDTANNYNHPDGNGPFVFRIWTKSKYAAMAGPIDKIYGSLNWLMRQPEMVAADNCASWWSNLFPSFEAVCPLSAPGLCHSTTCYGVLPKAMLFGLGVLASQAAKMVITTASAGAVLAMTSADAGGVGVGQERLRLRGGRNESATDTDAAMRALSALSSVGADRRSRRGA